MLLPSTKVSVELKNNPQTYQASGCSSLRIPLKPSVFTSITLCLAAGYAGYWLGTAD